MQAARKKKEDRLLEEQGCSFSPQLSKLSKRLNIPLGVDGMSEAYEAQQEQLKAARKAVPDECTFTPKLCKKSVSIQARGDQRSAAERLYEDAKYHREKMDEYRTKVLDAECSFAPHLVTGAREHGDGDGDAAHAGGGQVFDRLYQPTYIQEATVRRLWRQRQLETEGRYSP